MIQPTLMNPQSYKQEMSGIKCMQFREDIKILICRFRPIPILEGFSGIDIYPYLYILFDFIV
jgi:hypothetical protein